MAIIYKIQNKQNGKVYIGQTKYTLDVRLNNSFCGHFYRAFVKNCNTPLCNALRKYGKDSFTYEVLEEYDSLDCLEVEHWMNDREKYWISIYGSTDRTKGYNSTLGGQDSQIWTSEKRKEHSEMLKRYRLEHPEIYDNISKGVRQAYLDNPNLGKKISEASKKRLATLTDEQYQDWCSKISKSTSESIKKKYEDTSYRKRQKEGIQRYFRENGMSNTHKQSIVKSMLGTKLMYKNGIGKRVKQEDVEAYLSDGYELGSKAGRRQKCLLLNSCI